MRFYPNLSDGILATSFGSNITDSRVFAGQRASWLPVEIQPFTGTGSQVSPYALPSSFGLVCIIKQTAGDGQTALALQTSFTYDPVAGVYAGVINLGTVEMTQAFINGCTGINKQTGTTHAAVLADLNQLIAIGNAGAQVQTLPKFATAGFVAGQSIFLMGVGVGGTTVVAETGATITVASGAPVVVTADPTYTLLPGIPLMATCTGPSTWVLGVPPEATSINAFGQWAWWDASLASPQPIRLPAFPVTVVNYEYSGNEGTPESTGNATGYLLTASADLKYVRHDVTSPLIAADAKAARDNIGLALLPQALTAVTGTITPALPNLNSTYTLIGATVLALPSGTPFSGQSGLIALTQDGTGGRTLDVSAWSLLWAGDKINLTASAKTLYQWLYLGTTFYLLRLTDDLASFADRLGCPVATLTDGATITPALALSPVSNWMVTLAGNRVLALPTGTPAAGYSGTLIVTQDATGGRTLDLSAWTTFFTGSNIALTAGSVAVYYWFYTGAAYLLIRAAGRAAIEALCTADVTTGAVTSDNAAFLLTIPARTLAVGTRIPFEVAGNASIGSTATNLLAWLKVNGTKNTSVITQALTVSVAGQDWAMRGYALCTAIGATGTLRLFLRAELGTGFKLAADTDDITVDTTANITLSPGTNLSQATGVTGITTRAGFASF